MYYYNNIDDKDKQALDMTGEELIKGSEIPISVHNTNDELIRKIAHTMISDYEFIIKDKEYAVFIVPVGPVGQYDILAEEVLTNGLNLSKMILMGMDEYLTSDKKWIPEDDPLSFRNHIQRHLIQKIPPKFAPEIVFPNPENISVYTNCIQEHGGVDVSYCGVGITGHLAFNEPYEDLADPELMAEQITRIVKLREATITINSVTASRGNTLRIPEYAVTVGMKEILSAQKVRVFLNREWQSAVIRRLLFGEISGLYPSSLLQRHGNVSIDALRHILETPEPELR